MPPIQTGSIFKLQDDKIKLRPHVIVCEVNDDGECIVVPFTDSSTYSCGDHVWQESESFGPNYCFSKDSVIGFHFVSFQTEAWIIDRMAHPIGQCHGNQLKLVRCQLCKNRKFLDAKVRKHIEAREDKWCNGCDPPEENDQNA